jgi:hypothetical protein
LISPGRSAQNCRGTVYRDRGFAAMRSTLR